MKNRSGKFLVSLAFVSMCSACVSTSTGAPTEAERLERVAQARSDLSEGKARLNLVAAREADEERRWRTLLWLAQQVYDSGHFQPEAGFLVGKAYGKLGRHLDRVDVYRKVREEHPEAIPEQEYLDALVYAIDETNYRLADKRLELRMEVARLAPQHPAASAVRIRRDMRDLVKHYASKGRWEQLLTLVQTLAASPRVVVGGQPRHDGELDYFHAVALWKTGSQAQAQQKFEDYVGPTKAPDAMRRISKVANFYRQEGKDRRAVEMYERAVGRWSSEATTEQIELYAQMANWLLGSDDAADRRRGEKYLRYYVDVALATAETHRKDNIFYRARRIASRHKLQSVSLQLLERSVELGVASRYTIERLYKERLQRGETKQARALVESYLDSNDSRASALWHVADWAREAGKWKLAYRYMKQAVDKYPDNRDWWYDLAQIAVQVGEKKAAVKAVNKYLEGGRARSWDVRSAARFLKTAGMADAAVDVLETYQKDHPGDTRTAIYLAQMMIDRGERDRAKKMLTRVIKSEGISRYEMSDLTRYAQRVFGEKAAYPLYIAVAERGDPEAYLDAARIALNNDEVDKYDAVAQKYLGESTRFHKLQRLWYVLRRTKYEERKTKLLEAMIAADGGQSSTRYRAILAHQYFDQGEDARAFSLWDDRKHSKLRGLTFRAGSARVGGPDEAEKFIAQYEKQYPEANASAWMLYLVGEQYYTLYKAKTHGKYTKSATAEKLRDKARDHYSRALEASAKDGSVYQAAAELFDKRHMLDLAEQSLARQLSAQPNDRHSWYRYAQFLLKQGRYRAADQVFYRYIQGLRRKGKGAITVARKFANYQRDDKAEKYYKMALAYHENNELKEYYHRDILEDAGEGLGHIYLKSGRIEEFLELTSDFYAKYMGSHPYLRNHDRNIDLSGLRTRGQWDAYVERVEQIESTQFSRRESRNHARALWYSGDRKKAWDIFQKYLREENHNAGYKWRQLGEFLEERGGDELAATAYDRAVRYDGRYNRYNARRARARFLARRGHYEAAVQDFFAAAKERHYGKRAFDDMLRTFRQVGREDYALEAAQREDSPFKNDKVPAKLEEQFAQEDKDKAVARAKSLLKKGGNWRNVIDALSDVGHFEAMADLFEERLKAQEHAAVLPLIMRHANDLASVDRLEPLVSELEGHRFQDGQQALEQFLADYYLQNGQPERALVHLQRLGGIAGADDAAAIMLALGRKRGLAQKLAQRMSYYLRSSRHRRNLPLAVDFLRLGKQDTFATLVERFVRLETESQEIAPLYVSVLLEERGVQSAISFLRRTANELDERMQGGASASDMAGGLVRSMAIMAASGYKPEVAALLAELPEAVRERTNIRRFAKRMGVKLQQERPDQANQQAEKAQSWYTVSGRAKLLIVDGDYDRAEEILLAAFKAMIGEPSPIRLEGRRRVRNQQRALEQLLELYRVTQNQEGIDKVVALWTENLGRDNYSVDRLIEMLHEQGFEQAAADLARQTAENYPTGKILQQTIVTAAHAGDRETVEEFLPAYWRQLGMDGKNLGDGSIDYFVTRVDPEIGRLLLEPHLQARPKMYKLRASEVLLAFRAGDVTRGRELIADYLEEFSESQHAVDKLVHLLTSYDHHVEAARVIGPKMKLGKLSKSALARLADANTHLGRNKDALRYLDALVARASQPELQAASLAHAYVVDGETDLAAALVERAFARGGKLNRSRLARGLVRLAQGHEKAVEDIERGLKGWQGNDDVLAHVAVVALRAEKYSVAETYLTRLVRLPATSRYSHRHPLDKVIDALREADKPKWGVAFLDRTVPGLMGSPYLVESHQWTNAVGELLTAAGLLDRADRWYARAIEYRRLQGSSGYKLESLLDARALNLALNGGDAEKAEALSRKAIVMSRRTRSDYLSTLALAQYRSGKTEEAEQTLERAMRSKGWSQSMGEPGDILRELVDKGLAAKLGRSSSSTAANSLSQSMRLYDTYRYRYSRHRHRRYRNRGIGGLGTRGGSGGGIQILRGSP